MSELLEGRTDLEQYFNSGKTLENGIVLNQGPFQRRPGTRRVNEVKNSSQLTRIVKFIASKNSAFTLEFGNNYIRFNKNNFPVLDFPLFTTGFWSQVGLGAFDGTKVNDGLLVLNAFNTDAAIPGAVLRFDNGSPVALGSIVLTTAVGTSLADWAWEYSDNDVAYFTVTTFRPPANATTQFSFQHGVAHRFWRMRLLNTPGPGVAINEVQLGRIVEIATPYVSGDLRLLNFSQLNDVLYISSLFYESRKLLHYSDTVWQLTFLGKAQQGDAFRVPPSYEYGSRPLGGATLTVSAVSGAGVTATAGAATFQNADVGREIIVFNGPNVSARATITGFTSTTVVTITITNNFVTVGPVAVVDWKMIDSYKTGITPSAKTSAGTAITLTLDVAGWRTGDIGKFAFLNGGIAEITGITSTTVVNAILRSELNSVAKAESDAWSLEENAWSSTNGFATSDEFHDQRHYYGGTIAQPMTFWGSKVNDLENFAVGVLDDDGVEYTIGDNQLNAIVWLRSARHLLIGTTAGEFNVFGSQDAAITPLNIQARPETANGSTDDVAPLKIGAVVIYVAASTRRVREFVYDYSIDAYVSPDLLVLSEHLTRRNGLLELAYQREPWSLIWAVRDDGVLLSATYLRDQNVIAWTRQLSGSTTIDSRSGHQIAGDGIVESVCIIPHPNGDREQVWLIVQRIVGGQAKRFVEYIDDGQFVYDRLHTDCATTYNGTGLSILTLSGVSGNITATLSVAQFTIADVGRQIQLIGGPGQALITAFTSPTVVSASVVTPFASVGPFATGTWGIARKDIGPIPQLEGKVLDVVGEGAPQASVTILNGFATAQDFAIRMEVGIHYESVLQTVRPEPGGPRGSSQGLPKSISEVTVRVFETLGVQVNDQDDVVFRVTTDVNGQPPPLRTEDIRSEGLLGWDTTGRLTIRQKQPLPLTVTYMTGLTNVGGA